MLFIKNIKYLKLFSTDLRIIPISYIFHFQRKHRIESDPDEDSDENEPNPDIEELPDNKKLKKNE